LFYATLDKLGAVIFLYIILLYSASMFSQQPLLA